MPMTHLTALQHVGEVFNQNHEAAAADICDFSRWSVRRITCAPPRPRAACQLLADLPAELHSSQKKGEPRYFLLGI